jgi:predicted Zn-ribbon and HTH transcriptional regulator
MGGNKFKECEFCTYRWNSRVSSPKSCPRCKRRFDYKEARMVLEALGHEYGYDLTGDLQ